LLMDSGEMLFQAVLVHCLNSVSCCLVFLCFLLVLGVSFQIATIPHTCSQSVNGLLSVTSRTCNWEPVPPSIITQSV
jgi:hypothetical protein